MKQQCSACAKDFLIPEEDKAMIDRLSPVIGGSKIDIPLPTHCPDCRQQRRLAFRNDKHYYKNACSSCRKNVISIYSADKGLPILCRDCFWSDSFDPLAYGQDYDFSRPFCDQFAELKKRVPRLCIFNTQSENSDYTVHSSRNRNCYMSASTMRSEEVHFSDWAIDCRDSVDLVMCSNMELCADCNDSRRCFGSEELDLCSNCSDCTLCFDCHASQMLVGCVSMKNKKCMVLNQPCDEKIVKETRHRFMTDTRFRVAFVEKFEALKLACPKRAMWNLNVHESTGDYLQNTKGALHCFSSMDLEDCMYVYDTIDMENCMDVTRGSFSRNLYECKATSELFDSCFTNLCYQCDNLLYCDNAHGSSYSFGCFGLKKAKYCILNKQYTKEGYEALVPKIIENMRAERLYGEFLPMTLSSFAYNETKAYDYFPMTNEQVQQRGLQWKDEEQTPTNGLEMIDASRLPENIADVPDDILQIIISSEGSKKPFRIIPQELAFYRKRGLPVPRQHPHDRLARIIARENPRTLYTRACAKCDAKIQTTYAPERQEKVVCESCYLKEVY